MSTQEIPGTNLPDRPSGPTGDQSVSNKQESFSGKVIRNTLFNVVGSLWSIAIRFFMAKYIFDHIGNERHGVWFVVGILTGYFGLLDFGLARSFDKFFAEYHTKRDYDRFNKVFNIGFVFYFLFSVITIGVIFLLYEPLMSMLGLSRDRVSTELFQESAFAMIGSVIIFGLGMSTSVFGMMMIGLQRMDIFNKISISFSILGAVGTLIVLEAGYGLRGLVVNNGIIVVLGGAVNVMAAYHLVPTLKFNPFMAEWEMFRKMFNFGTKLQVAKLANLLAFQLNTWLISAFLHVGMVTPYGFATGFIGSIRNVLLMLPSAVIPATSELESRNEKERSLEFYDRGTRYLVLFGTPICTFSIVTASLVMLAWLGPEYKLLTESVWVVKILAIGYYANLSTGVATGVAVGMGKPEYEMKFGVMLAIFSLVLCFGLVYFIGFYGPAVGSTISLTVCALYFYKLFHRYLKQPMIPFLTRMYGMPILISTLAGLVISVLQWQLVNTFEPVSRLPILAVILLEGLVFSAVYMFLILRTSYMDAYDLNLFRRYLEKFGLR